MNRKIVISAPIDSYISGEVISHIMEINDFDDKMSVLSTYVPEPIEIFINSPGGSANDGFAIIAAMEMSETPIITYGIGLVASMALGIFAKGDFRIAHRYTRFLYHSVSYGEYGYIKDHEDSYKETDYLQRMYDDLFKDTLITKEKMESVRNSKSNYIFSGKEAVDLKVADHVMLKPAKKNFGISETDLGNLKLKNKENNEQ